MIDYSLNLQYQTSIETNTKINSQINNENNNQPIKSVYNSLEIIDCNEYLIKYQNQNITAVISSDVLTYIGNLNNIFKNVKLCLKRNGLFGFTTELLTDSNNSNNSENSMDYFLQPTARYSHSISYIKLLSKQYNYELLSINEDIIRYNGLQPIKGLIVVLKNNN